MKSRSTKQQLIYEDKENMRTIVLDRKTIAETGLIPTGMRFLTDSAYFEVVKTEKVLKESKDGMMPTIKATGLIQRGNAENANTRFYDTRSVLKPAIESIQKDISDRAVLGEYDHPCFLSDDFRVLTTEGWKDFKDIKEGDTVYSRVNGKMVESVVYGIVNEPYAGTAYRVSGKNINVEFSPGHRVLMEKKPSNGDNTQLYATIEDIYHNRSKYSHSRIPKTAEFSGTDQPLYTIPGLDVCDLPKTTGGRRNIPDYTKPLVFETKKFVKFLGLYLAEGYTRNNGIHVCQINAHSRMLIKDLLGSLHHELEWNELDTCFYANDPRLAKYLKNLGDKYTKFIPQDIKKLSSEYLEDLISWFAIGDGRMLSGSREGAWESSKQDFNSHSEVQLLTEKYTRASVFTVSKQLSRDLHECIVKAGKSARLSEVVTEEDYVYAGREIKASNKTVLYNLSILKSKGFYLDERYTAIDQFHHDGKIFCLTVQHGNFYVEHKGMTYWTGNCDAKIHLDRVSHLMSNVWMEGNKVFGEIEVLHLLPLGACLRGLFEHKVRVGISSRGVGDMEIAEHKGKEIYRVLPGFQFVTWDVVAEPSVNGAVLNIQEGLNRRINPIKKNRKNFSPEVYQDKLVKEINSYFGLK